MCQVPRKLGVEESEGCLPLPLDNMSRRVKSVIFAKRTQFRGEGCFGASYSPAAWWGLAQGRIRLRRSGSLLNPDIVHPAKSAYRPLALVMSQWVLKKYLKKRQVSSCS